MLCEICKKNEATIHIQEIVGGQKKSVHLCSSCAAAKQQQDGFDFGPFNLAGLLYKLSSPPKTQPKAGKNSGAELKCPQCNWDSEKLGTTGRVGCSNCYNVFGERLEGVLKNIQHGTSHVGKRPGNKGGNEFYWHSEIARLQQKMQQAIKDEEYELAAECRDRIDEIQRKFDNSSQTAGGSDHE